MLRGRLIRHQPQSVITSAFTLTSRQLTQLLNVYQLQQSAQLTGVYNISPDLLFAWRKLLYANGMKNLLLHRTC